MVCFQRGDFKQRVKCFSFSGKSATKSSRRKIAVDHLKLIIDQRNIHDAQIDFSSFFWFLGFFILDINKTANLGLISIDNQGKNLEANANDKGCERRATVNSTNNLWCQKTSG